MIKKNVDPQLGFLWLTIVFALSALTHGLLVGVDFSTAFNVIPFIALSVFGQLLYGICLTQTLKRGDLSTYYPIIRASPVFVVIASVLLLGKTYSLLILLGIGMIMVGSFLLLYRRNTHFLDNPKTLVLALIAMSGSGIYSLSDAYMMKVIDPQVSALAVEVLIVPFYFLIWIKGRDSTRSLQPTFKFGTAALLLLPGILAYISYYLILLAYQSGGDVAAVTSLRQASIPISVALGGLFLREGAMLRRFFASGLLALGIVVIALTS